MLALLLGYSMSLSMPDQLTKLLKELLTWSSCYVHWFLCLKLHLNVMMKMMLLLLLL